MSEAARDAPRPPAFSPKVVLALVLVGVVSFSALAVLSAYAPDLRADQGGGANALSSSAVGFKGAVIMLKAMEAPTVISRAPPSAASAEDALLVLTPPPSAEAQALRKFPRAATTLIVLPKWQTAPDRRRPGFVEKVGLQVRDPEVSKLLSPYAKATTLARRSGVSRPVLRGTGNLFTEGTVLPLDQVDRLQTVAGAGWAPVLVDEQGRMVLARSRTASEVFLLSDPDLLNTQGLARLDNARAGMAVVNGLRAGGGVIFDVTLNGYTRGRGLWRMLLEPPWLAATLCGVAAAVLMGLQALARFGPAQVRGRAFALGKQALVDNSAGLVRMARREHELAPAYVDLTKALIGRAAGGEHGGGGRDAWLAELARVRRTDSPSALAAEAARAKSRDDVVALARKLYRWRLEMTRERR